MSTLSEKPYVVIGHAPGEDQPRLLAECGRLDLAEKRANALRRQGWVVEARERVAP
jgi:hypothetical protein